MTPRISRRGLLGGVVGAGLATGLVRSGTDGAAAAATARRASSPVVRPGADPQFDSLIAVSNRRFRAEPARVFTPRTGEETVAAVQAAVDSQDRVSVISGGHCFEDFSLPADVRTVIHVGALAGVRHDDERGVYGVGSGARLLGVYETLFRDHGVTLPGGVCYSVGAGGHVTGGGYGLLSRAHGLTVDHLVGVEVVTVDRAGRARLDYVRASDRGARGDLFWAHTGGGGGSFGVVTRFDFRTEDTARGLPSPPATVRLASFGWPWDDVTAEALEAFLGVFADWCRDHHASDPETDAVFPWLVVRHRDHGGIGMVMQVADDAGLAVARSLVADLAAALGRPALVDDVRWEQMPWMNAVRLIGTGSAENHDPNRRGKQGSANLRGRFATDQVRHLHEALTTSIPGSVSAGMDIAALGGAIARRGAAETAVFQRDATMKFLVQTFWEAEEHDAANIAWLRGAYHGLFPGGAPGYDDTTAGSYVNYPDSDLSDPAWNTTGLSAGDLYFGDNHARLRRAKAAWDPQNHFRHAQSVTA